MGYINLTGDSDGDLHTAAMHNSKFGAIASVLNGNIDRDNLSAPRSLLNWSFGTGFGRQIPGVGTVQTDNDVLSIGTDKTTGINTADWQSMTSTNHYFMMLNSLKKAPANMTLVSIDAVIYQSNGSLADDYTLLLQKSDGITGTYSDMSTGPFKLNQGSVSTILPAAIAMSTTDSSINQNQYFRALFHVPASPGTYIPEYPQIHINCTWKAYHIA